MFLEKISYKALENSKYSIRPIILFNRVVMSRVNELSFLTLLSSHIRLTCCLLQDYAVGLVTRTKTF